MTAKPAKTKQKPKAKRSLLDIAKAAKRPTHQPKTWLDALSDEERAEVMEIAAGLADGTFPGSIRCIADAWKAAGVACSKGKLQALVSKIRDGVKA
jgi:hypothetical protein